MTKRRLTGMHRRLLLAVVCGTIAVAQSPQLNKNDSIFKKFTVDEIVTYKQSLENRKNRNIKRQELLTSEGLRVNKSILESKESIGANQDVMLLRLAEFYIDEALAEFFDKQDALDKQYDDYITKLEAWEQDSVNNPKPVEPKPNQKDFSKALSMYNKILTDFPKSEYIDEALYNKAFLLKDAGKGSDSRVVYNDLIERFPKSVYTPYAIMELADYYFEPGVIREEDQVESDLLKAADYFKQVLTYKDFDRYDEALYRLGWTYYKLAVRDPKYYKDAVIYFTLALDDIASGSKYSIAEQYTNVNIKNEATRYIGICFTQEDNPKGGVDNLRKYVEKLMELKKPYAADIMKSIGDIYYDVREDENTIKAYSAFQELFPFNKESARIQNRIVESYRAFDEEAEYLSDSKSYGERYKLFKKYNSKSDWYNQLLAMNLDNKFEILQESEKNAELALFRNIQILYRDILDKEQKAIVDTADYGRLATYCAEYLEFFPNFDNAFVVHKNYAIILDTKLSRFSKAYEEYIEASNIYPNAPVEEVKKVAYNAVIVADTLRGLAGDKNINFEFSNTDSIKAEPLTESERRQIESYENYIKIAPNDSNSAKFLSNISAIYFNRKNFAEANRYAKTLLLQFPGAEGEALARQQIMNSYYARGQFLSSEAMAKKIMNDPESDPAHIAEAKLRFFDSVLKNAQFYQMQNKHYIAGLEFRRAAVEAPFEERKDLRFIALYNSGLEFEKANDLEEAVVSYSLIINEGKKENLYTYRALNNTALNLNDLNQKRTAAEFFEKIYRDYPDSAQAKQNLANASALYVQSSSWLDAIRVNNTYAARYPADEDAKDFLFNNAEYFLKLDDFASANQIYNEFTAKYPDDPRTIEAHYKRGKYYLDRGNLAEARPEFQRAIDRNERFKRENKKVDNYHAAESAYELIQMQERDYDAITFKWPPSNITANKKRKTDLLAQIKDNYQKLISYGSPRSFEAPYKIALLHEKIADTFSEQETNPNERDQAKKIAEEGKIRATAANLYDDAIKKYKEAITNIDKIASKLKVDLSDNYQAEVDTSSARNEIESIRRVVIDKDSLRNVALEYKELSKEKITSVVFLIAKQSEENILNTLNYQSKYANRVGQESNFLVERDLILDRAVKKSIEASVTAHRRNMTESSELEIRNKFTEESKRRIIVNSNIVADAYNDLTSQSLNYFNTYFTEFIKLIPQPYGRRSSLLKMDYAEINDNLSQYLDFAKDYNVKSLTAYTETVGTARKDSISNDLSEYTVKSIFNGPLRFVETMQTLRDSVDAFQKRFQAKYDQLPEDNELKYNFQDGADNLREVSLVIKDNIEAALEAAYNTKEDFGLNPTPNFNKILKKLIQIDPNRYSDGIPKDTLRIVSDDTWLVSKDNAYEDSVMFTNFNDSAFKKPYVINDTISIAAFDTLPVKPKSIWYADEILTRTETDSSIVTNAPQFVIDTLTNDTTYFVSTDSLGQPIPVEIDSATGLPIGFVPQYATKTVQFSADTVDSIRLYFRKKFNLPGKVSGGKFFGTGDGLTDLFMSGELISNFANPEYERPDSGDFTFFQDYISIGENVINIWVTDTAQPRKGMKFYLEILVLPLEFSHDGVVIVDETTYITDQQEKQIQRTIKNRIPLKPISQYENELKQLKQRLENPDKDAGDKTEKDLNNGENQLDSNQQKSDQDTETNDSDNGGNQ